VLMLEFMQQGTTIMSEVYCKTLKKLCRAMGLLTSRVVLLCDNAYPHTAAHTWALLKHFIWKLFYHPPYSPDLTPSDYHLFTCAYLKNCSGSQRYNNNEELMEGVKVWLSSQAADFFDTGIHTHIPWYAKCLSPSDDYVEKLVKYVHIFVYNNFFSRCLFVNSSLEITLRIALIQEA
jgi:transposase